MQSFENVKIINHNTQHKSLSEILKNSWIRKFYLKYLKKNSVVFLFVKWIKTDGFLVFIKIKDFFAKVDFKSWYTITRFNDYLKKNDIKTERLEPAVNIIPSTPKIFPANENLNFVASVDNCQFPEINLAVLKNARIYGGTNLVFVGSEAICHDLYNFRTDYTSEELHRRIIVNPQKNTIRCLLKDEQPFYLKKAASFIDACANNYAHWMTEVLPRIVLFCSSEKYKDIPVVVNEGLHENIMESLLLTVGANREIYTVPNGRALLVDKMYLTSAAGYVPFDVRSESAEDCSHGIFSPNAMIKLRDFFQSICRNDKCEKWPEKIYLKRNSNVRKVVNISELESLMSAYGYETVEPERLSFIQQFKLFHNATTIVSPTGAALSNAVFCKPGTNVAVIMGKHKNMIYKYWTNLLSPLKINVFYLLGDIVQNNHLGIHGDISINLSDFNDLMEALEKQCQKSINQQ